MQFLLFVFNGDIKRFPLHIGKKLIVGRSAECDLAINLEFISRKHFSILINDDSIEIEDLNSTNGLYSNSKKRKKFTLSLNNSFFVEDLEFILKRGNIDDFTISKELSEFISVKRKHIDKNENTGKSEITRYFKGNIIKTLTRGILKRGLKSESIESFFMEVNDILSGLLKYGTLIIIKEIPENFSILSKQNFNDSSQRINFNFLPDSKQLFSEEFKEYNYTEDLLLYSASIKADNNFAFLFITTKKIHPKWFIFLKNYLEIIKILYYIIPKYKKNSIDLSKNNDQEVEYIVTVNKEMKKLIKQVKKLSKTDIFVQIAGDSGVGKELFARLLHENSIRRKNKYVALNCAAIAENLLESELFGHEKGSFTGAIAQKKGKLELSSGGTLFLDEIGDMQLDLQVKLLRAIQEGTFYRVGGTELVKVDLRIISATNKNLEMLVKEEKFREDLYYRLVHVSINIPPLRERKNDITPLISYFSQKTLEKIDKKIIGYSVKALNTLNEYDWPGNVRELENEVYKLVNLVDDDELIDFDLLSPKIQMFSQDLVNTIKISNIKGKLGEVEKDNILKSLIKNNWNKTETSRELGMSYNTLFRKIKKYSIKK